MSRFIEQVNAMYGGALGGGWENPANHPGLPINTEADWSLYNYMPAVVGLALGAIEVDEVPTIPCREIRPILSPDLILCREFRSVEPLEPSGAVLRQEPFDHDPTDDEFDMIRDVRTALRLALHVHGYSLHMVKSKVCDVKIDEVSHRAIVRQFWVWCLAEEVLDQ